MPRDRRAIREGKRPVVEPDSSSSDDEGSVQPPPGPRRPAGTLFIGRRPEVPSRPQGRTLRSEPSTTIQPAPPLAAGLSPAGPGGLSSTITLEDLEVIGAQYRVPACIRLSVPGPEDRVAHVLPGRVALYEEFLRCGLRLPFHPFIPLLLDWYGLALAQLTPNSIRIICCFVVLCCFHGSAASLSLFRALYKLRHHTEPGWFIFASRPGRTLPLRLPSKIKGWKSRFFYADVEGVRARWGEPDAGPSKDPPIDKRDRELYDRLESSEIPSYRELLKEENLVEAELAPAVGKLGSASFCLCFAHL